LNEAWAMASLTPAKVIGADNAKGSLAGRYLCRTGRISLFNTGEMNPRDVPAENMRAMVKAVRTYSI